MLDLPKLLLPDMDCTRFITTPSSIPRVLRWSRERCLKEANSESISFSF